MQIAVDAVVTSTCAVISPIVVRDDVQLFSPITKAIHEQAIKTIHSSAKSRCFQLLHYFGKPVDRLIQAVVAPIFLQINYFNLIKQQHDKKNYGWMALGIVASPLVVPIALVAGLLESIVLVANGIFQIVIPYQTIYSVAKGKEAAKEYFDYRRELCIEERKFCKNISVRVLTEKPHQRPKKTLKEICKEHPRNTFVDVTFYVALIFDAIMNTCFAFLWFLHPSNLFPFGRAVAVA